MAIHKYRIGQQLNYKPPRSAGVRASACKIVRLLPAEDGEPQYRIKCTNEPVERVVKENALTR
ncbi:MAG: hypothetical protein SFW09_20160 [Hyphomicrobiaceae bacterium]|nr:hypothetical protein [Hyphomicrobiaceae bacterium]